MAVYHTKAIVLKNRNLGEADRILLLLSEDSGKIEAVVKGARRQHSRFIGNTLPFNYLDLMLFTGKNLDQVSQAELIHPFTTLREDLVKMAYASFWVELTDGFIPESEGHGEVFRFLLAAFITLERSVNPDLLNLAFEARLLNYLGYQPQLDSCTQCESSGEIVFFSPANGGVVCRRCAPVQRDLIPVTRKEIELLSGFGTTDIRQLECLDFTPANLQTIRRILRDFIEFRLDRPLKSQIFLDQVCHGDGSRDNSF
jgi:DNA repair protein RecO (recombination protein O)